MAINDETVDIALASYDLLFQGYNDVIDIEVAVNENFRKLAGNLKVLDDSAVKNYRVYTDISELGSDLFSVVNNMEDNSVLRTYVSADNDFPADGALEIIKIGDRRASLKLISGVNDMYTLNVTPDNWIEIFGML